MKNKVLNVVIISIFGLFSLIHTLDLKQKNPETIFLTDPLIKEYEKFKSIAPEKQFLIVKKQHSGNDIDQVSNERSKFYHELSKLEKMCIESCEIISENKLRKIKPTKINIDVDQNKDAKLMVLESNKDSPFTAAIFIDESEVSLKKILKNMLATDYWSDKSVKFSGLPYTNYLLDHYSESIQNKLFPVMFILGFILTFTFINNIKESVIIYLPCLYLAGMSLNVLKYIDGNMNMVTSIIPLVVFSISLSLSFHIFYSIKEFKSVHNFLIIKWKPLFLMIFTTYVGFLGLVVAEISVIKKFGYVSSHLILLSTLVLYFWYRSFEQIIAKNPNKGRVFKFENIFYRTIPLKMIIVLFSCGVFSLYYFPQKLEIITDATRYFPLSTGHRENIIDVTKNVIGMPVVEIVFDLGREIDFEQSQKMEHIEEKLLQLKLSQKYQLISNNSLVRKINSSYSQQYDLPDNYPSYLALRSQLPASLQDTYQLSRFYRVTLMGSPVNVAEYKQDLKMIKETISSNNMKYQINGLHHNLMLSQDTMISVLYESFFVSALLVFIVSVFYLQNIRLIIAFAIVNTLPVMLAFLYMYIMRYSVNIATVMTFSIALGLLGDSTFHISHAKLYPFRKFSDYSSAVLTPVLLSGILLCICFSIFLYNDFLPIKEFGGILSFMIIGGYISDLYILPTIIYGNSNHLLSYENEIHKNTTWQRERLKKINT